MMCRLRDIVNIKSGVFAKGDANPDLYYIQATDFNKQRNWDKKLNYVLSNSEKLKKHILYSGELLFAAKGKDFFAVVYDGKYEPAVASSTFLVLQVHQSGVLPDFVAWFLNHPKTQSLLWSFAKGSGTPSISISVLENIEITVPDLSKQTSILELDRLQKVEKKLHKQIYNLREDYLNELTYKSLQ